MTIPDEIVEKALDEFWGSNTWILRSDIKLSDMRAALTAVFPDLTAAAVAGERIAGLTEAREIASGQFGWDIDVWRDMTKKDMAHLMAEAIVAAIDARIAALAKT